MIVANFALFAWTSLSYEKWGKTSITYSIEKDFCDKILHKFLEDRFLSFHSIDCDDVKWTLRRSFSAWEYNSDHLKFKEVSDSDTEIADIHIRYQDVEKDNVLGTATIFKYSDGHHIEKAMITIDDSFCFYIDNVFCHRMNQFEASHNWFLPFLKALLISFCIIYSGILISLQIQSICYHRTNRQRLLLTFGTMMGLFIPFLFWGVIVPCTNCHDFNILMTHEIGHSLGFGHSDEDYNQCGCVNVTLCEPDLSSILVSKANTRPNACLSQSDADGLHHTYNESCKSVVCFPSASESYMGYTRGVMSILLPILASLAVSATIHCTERRIAKSNAHTSLALSPP